MVCFREERQRDYRVWEKQQVNNEVRFLIVRVVYCKYIKDIL